MGVFHAKGWWPKTSCPPSKLCLPWVSKRGIRDVPGILPGCPGPLAVFKKFVQKNFVRIFRSLKVINTPKLDFGGCLFTVQVFSGVICTRNSRHSQRNSHTCTHDLSHEETQFWEKFLERLLFVEVGVVPARQIICFLVAK